MEEHLKEALEIVKAQASVRDMTEEEITSMAKSLSENIKALAGQIESLQDNDLQTRSKVDPKKAIKEKSVVCLECDKTFKALTKRHLASHNLTPAEYKEKWGYKKSTALVAKSLARARRDKILEMQLWKKKKNYLESDNI
ncbi:MAG TPA: MucR family transcriptional regulator [Desulfohalobiaceae bacterium]|nr:MucR family transcriptional regulator [Desulfohalobiaceae bacterium]